MKNKDNFVVILDEITVPCTRDEDKRIYWGRSARFSATHP